MTVTGEPLAPVDAARRLKQVDRMRLVMAVEWGTLADWANVVVTALTFGIALVLFFIGRQDRRRAMRTGAKRTTIGAVARPGRSGYGLTA